MRKLSLLASTALGIALGAALFSARPAWADLPVFDLATDLLMRELNNLVTGAINQVETAVTGVGTTLTRATDQVTRNIRATVGAQEQIQDGSNTAMATYQRNMRNADIVANHVVTPAACLALDGGQSISVSGRQADTFSRNVGAITNPRGEAGPATPAWEGAGQAAIRRPDLRRPGHDQRRQRLCHHPAAAGAAGRPARRSAQEHGGAAGGGGPAQLQRQHVAGAQGRDRHLRLARPHGAADPGTAAAAAGRGAAGAADRLLV